MTPTDLPIVTGDGKSWRDPLEVSGFSNIAALELGDNRIVFAVKSFAWGSQ